MVLERWQTYWSWLFYGLLLIATGVAAAGAESDDRRVASLALAAGLAVWYWQAVVRDGPFAGGGPRAFLLTIESARGAGTTIVAALPRTLAGVASYEGRGSARIRARSGVR